MSEKQPEAMRLENELRDTSAGYDEWRVQSPDDGSYCMAYSWKESINPEREAREWLADHKSRFPDSQYAGYVVEKVRVLTQADRLMQKAAAELRRQRALLEEMAGAIKGYVCTTRGAEIPPESELIAISNNTGMRDDLRATASRLAPVAAVLANGRHRNERLHARCGTPSG